MTNIITYRQIITYWQIIT